MSGNDVLRSELAALGRDRGITSIQRLSGGAIADTWLVSYADGSRVVGETMAGAPAGLFRVEAEGLAVLRGTGHLPAPATCPPRPSARPGHLPAPASRRFFDVYQDVNPSPPG